MFSESVQQIPHQSLVLKAVKAWRSFTFRGFKLCSLCIYISRGPLAARHSGRSRLHLAPKYGNLPWHQPLVSKTGWWSITIDYICDLSSKQEVESRRLLLRNKQLCLHYIWQNTWYINFFSIILVFYSYFFRSVGLFKLTNQMPHKKYLKCLTDFM